MVLSVCENKEDASLKFVSAKSFLPLSDIKMAVDAGTLLVALVKLIKEIMPKAGAELADNALSDLARKRIKEECDQRGFTNCQLGQLTITAANRHKAISTIISTDQFKAGVMVDDLGNVTFTKPAAISLPGDEHE